MKIQAPAVHSARLAVKKALEMKSFMEEKMAGAQLQHGFIAHISNVTSTTFDIVINNFYDNTYYTWEAIG